MAIVGIHRSDSMRADTDAFCRADTEAANRIAPCSDSNLIRTRSGQEIPRSDINIEVFSQVSKTRLSVSELFHILVERVTYVKSY